MIGVGSVKVLSNGNNAGERPTLKAYVQVDGDEFPLLSEYQGLLHRRCIRNTELHILPNGFPILGADAHQVQFLYKEIFEDGFYFRNGIIVNEESCVVEVGAKIGMFAVFLNLLSTEIKVYSSEASLEEYNKLAANRSLYRVKGKAFNQESLDLSWLIGEEKIGRIDLLKIDMETSGHLVLNSISGSDWDRIRNIVLKVNGGEEMLEKMERDLTGRGFSIYFETVRSFSSDELAYYLFAVRNSQTASLAAMIEKYKGRLSGWVDPMEFKKRVRYKFEKKLPVYMWPSQIILLDKMPLTQNGKLDHKALGDIEADEFLNTLYEPPTTNTEIELTSIWQELLKRDRIGIRENLFELGAHSLMMVQAASIVRRRLLLEIPFKVFFEFSNIETLSKYVDFQIFNGSLPEESILAYEVVNL
jgi:acyl carrier protein